MMEDKYIFECIKLINETNIEFKKNNMEDYTSDREIQKMLENKELFSVISKEKAYEILNELGINNIDEVYKMLKGEMVD